MKAVHLLAFMCLPGVIALPSVAGEAPADSAADAKRAQRETPVAIIAPAPAAGGTPLAGPAGKGADGYPTQYVDLAALRSLLSRKQYGELTRYFEQFQSAFEANPRHEYWPIDASDAFASAEPELRPALDAWVAATPQSFAPYLARGRYWVSAAFARRGTAFADKTASGDFAAMEQALKQAAPDLDRALELRPKLIAALRVKMMAQRDPGRSRAIVDQAIAICPSCFQVRVTHMFNLTPRWGGSHNAMGRFARERIDPSNPKSKLLPGYVDNDKAQLLVLEKKPKEALAAIERACALGDHWEFLSERGSIKDHLRDFEGAIKDFDRALALRPGHPTVIIRRGYTQHRAQRWEASGRDLVAGLRMAPTDATARAMIDTTVAGLVYDGWNHHTAGRRNDALRLYDLAAELAPNNGDVQSRRATIVLGKPAGGSVDLAALEDRVRKSPDDFRAVQQLDYALAQQQNFPRVVELWTAYLARNPKDGAAHLERGGAQFRMRKLAEAHADATKACELGNSEGCVRAKQIGPLPKK